MNIINIPNNGSETLKFYKLFSVPKNSDLWGAMYGRYDIPFRILIAGSNNAYICNYMLHIGNDNIKINALNTPNVDIAYKVNGNNIDVYIRMPNQNYRGFMYADNFIAITPYINNKYDTEVDTLTMLLYANTQSKNFSYSDTDYQINLDFVTVANIVYVTGTIKVLNEKTTTGYVDFGSIPTAVNPKSLKHFIPCNRNNNIYMQIFKNSETDYSLRIQNTADEGTYFVNYFYSL